MDEMASWVINNNLATAQVTARRNEMFAQVRLFTQRVFSRDMVASGQVVSVRNSTGLLTANGSVVLTGLFITSLDLGATSTLVNTGQTLTGVTPTGTFTTTVTFTVAGGVISAIALS
jgi:hypothetical protein